MVENNAFLGDLARIQADQIGRSVVKPKVEKQGSTEFKNAFEQKLAELTDKTSVKFSSHAIQRLHKRNIDITTDTLNKINEAVAKANLKGAKESLIMVDDLALIVSVKNNTVITAMDRMSMKDQVVTNIDSAVIT
jgi:flagellar operon protein